MTRHAHFSLKTLDSEVTRSLTSINTITLESRTWQWLSTLFKIQRQIYSVRSLTCLKSPICSISSLKCSIFLLIVKLGSVELYSWRFPLVKAEIINQVHCSKTQITHRGIHSECINDSTRYLSVTLIENKVTLRSKRNWTLLKSLSV